MTKTESTIRFLFGASRKDIRPLVHAVDITIKLMFSQGIPMDDIRVTHAVYPQVAKRLKTRSGASPSAKTTARRIQRLANACWDALVERNLVKEFLGTSLRDLQAPRDLLFYLAAFSHLPWATRVSFVFSAKQRTVFYAENSHFDSIQTYQFPPV